MKTVLFLRNYLVFSGGHLKLLHYMQHTAASGFAQPRLWLSPASVRDSSNIFLEFAECIVSEPCQHDLLFLGGMDWPAADSLGLLRSGTPIVNLMQATAHGNPDDPFRPWLSHPATRIFVGPEIAQAVMATGLVCGPTHTITVGLEPIGLPSIEYSARTVDVFVSGLKAPDLAQQVSAKLREWGIAVDLLIDRLPRIEFLDRLRRAKAAVLIPLPQEGCYLPSWEAMAFDVAVVCTDTPGVHSYCRDRETALLVDRDPNALAQAARRLLFDKALRNGLLSNGRRVVSEFSLDQERRAFLPLLARALGHQ